MTKEEINLYKVLGVKRNATLDEIKSAYKKMAKKLHPDVDGGSEEAFKNLSLAYEVLLDDNLRAIYDATGETEKVDNSERIFSFLQDEAITRIMNANGIVKTDLIQRIKSVITNSHKEFIDSIQTNELSIEKIQYVLKRLKLKDEENVEDIFKDALNEKNDELESEIKFYNLELSFLSELAEFMDRYEYIIDELVETAQLDDSGDDDTLKIKQ